MRTTVTLDPDDAGRAGTGGLPAPVDAQRHLRQAADADQALELMNAWLEHPAARLMVPTERHAALLSSPLLARGRGGDLVSDAHIAALAAGLRMTLPQ